MPKLWTKTIEEHRREVNDAVLDATADLVSKHGLLSVTMTQIAEKSGIGRATLYKYFPDVEKIMMAWHERHVEGHLARLFEIRDKPGDPLERLTSVLQVFAEIAFNQHHLSELHALLHNGPHVITAQKRLRKLIRDLLAEGAAAGQIRRDVVVAELADYCLHALSAASRRKSAPAVRRLVSVTLSGIYPLDRRPLRKQPVGESEVDDEPGAVDDCGDEWARHDGGVETQPSQGKR